MFGPLPRHEIAAIAENLLGLEHLKFTHLGRIAEFNNFEEDRITLDIFKTLLQIPNLKSLNFSTCSITSLDWDTIGLWCASADGTPGFSYSEKYFQAHGEYFRNGITVDFNDEFKRDSFDWGAVPSILLESQSGLSTTPSFTEASTSFPQPGLSSENSDDSL